MLDSEKKKTLAQAKKHCCNWVNHVCIGAMMKHENGMLYQTIDSKYANKPCKAYSCDYFENIVNSVKSTDYIDLKVDPFYYGPWPAWSIKMWEERL